MHQLDYRIPSIKASPMDIDDQRPAFFIGRNVQVELLLRSAVQDVRQVSEPGNTCGNGRVGLFGTGPSLCAVGGGITQGQGDATRRCRPWQTADSKLQISCWFILGRQVPPSTLQGEAQMLTLHLGGTVSETGRDHGSALACIFHKRRGVA
jgi:hypothetical protein